MEPGVHVLAPRPGETAPAARARDLLHARAADRTWSRPSSGWIDEHGRARLAARSLPRDPVTLGPAQISRLVFATPRVSNLLGLRNLEIRDLDKSSLDAVLLGTTAPAVPSGGVVQIQSLYEGSRGPGAARLIGVTAFLNGRAGLGSGHRERRAAGAERAAAGRRPCHLTEPVVVGKPVELRFRVAERAAGGRHDHVRARVANARRSRSQAGVGSVRWVPSSRRRRPRARRRSTGWTGPSHRTARRSAC